MPYYLFRIGDSEAAIRDYNAVLAIDPSNVQGYRGRGFLHHYQGDIVNALRDLNKALELSPNDGRCFVHRGFVWLSLSEWSRAKQELMLGSESVDVATLITNLYGTISAFEQRHDVELPEDIVKILTSTSREHLQPKDDYLISKVDKTIGSQCLHLTSSTHPPIPACWPG